MNMLDVRSLYVTYLSEEERVEAVRGIDFSAEEGKVTGIVGESGSGKSTAMMAVMGLLDHKAAVEAEKVSLLEILSEQETMRPLFSRSFKMSESDSEDRQTDCRDCAE